MEQTPGEQSVVATVPSCWHVANVVPFVQEPFPGVQMQPALVALTVHVAGAAQAGWLVHWPAVLQLCGVSWFVPAQRTAPGVHTPQVASAGLQKNWQTRPELVHMPPVHVC